MTTHARMKLALKVTRPAVSAAEEKARERSRAEGRGTPLNNKAPRRKAPSGGAGTQRGWAHRSVWPWCGRWRSVQGAWGGGPGPGGSTHHGVVVAVGVGVAVLLVPLVVLLLLQGRGFRLRHILWGGPHAVSLGSRRPRPPLTGKQVNRPGTGDVSPPRATPLPSDPGPSGTGTRGPRTL